MTITREDLRRGLRLAVPNQGICITPDWITVEVKVVTSEDVFYIVEPFKMPWNRTPIERFLEIVNAPPKGPHHSPKPEL